MEPIGDCNDAETLLRDLLFQKSPNWEVEHIQFRRIGRTLRGNGDVGQVVKEPILTDFGFDGQALRCVAYPSVFTWRLVTHGSSCSS